MTSNSRTFTLPANRRSTMVPQRATAESARYEPASTQLATAASRYQRFREAEKEHLALMARHDLFAEWTPDVQMTVMAARACIHAASAARASFRAEIRGTVLARRESREPLSAVLRHMRSVIERLEETGALQSDGGWLETEVLEWSIEEYETAH